MFYTIFDEYKRERDKRDKDITKYINDDAECS